MTELRVHDANLSTGGPRLAIHEATLTSIPEAAHTELRIHWAGLTSASPPPVGPGAIWISFDGETWTKCRRRVCYELGTWG